MGKVPFTFKIEGTVYPFDIVCSIWWDREIAKKHLLKFGVPESEVEMAIWDGQGRTMMFESGYTIIRLKHIPKCPVSYQHFVHEATHATQFLMNKIWTPLSPDTYESYAYHTAWLVKEILEAIL